jgi:hypothetical protein
MLIVVFFSAKLSCASFPAGRFFGYAQSNKPFPENVMKQAERPEQ